MNIKCVVGLHDWKHTKPHCKNPARFALNMPDIPATRTCRQCGKFQIRRKDWKSYGHYNWVWETNIKLGGKNGS